MSSLGATLWSQEESTFGTNQGKVLYSVANMNCYRQIKWPNNIWLSSRNDWDCLNSYLSTWILKGKSLWNQCFHSYLWNISSALGTTLDSRDWQEHKADTSLLSQNVTSSGRRKTISKRTIGKKTQLLGREFIFILIGWLLSAGVSWELKRDTPYRRRGSLALEGEQLAQGPCGHS